MWCESDRFRQADRLFAVEVIGDNIGPSCFKGAQSPLNDITFNGAAADRF